MAELYAHHLDRTTARQKDPYDPESPLRSHGGKLNLKLSVFT